MIDRVKIGCLDYKIQLRDFTSSTDLGEIIYKSLIININENMNSEVQNETLFHEIAHGLIARSSLTNDCEMHEKIAIVLGQGFYEVLKTNPELVQMLQEQHE
jgi:Zn-dependent peptidase ImmA (M78 family)